jgi:hypothetical protein
MHLVIGRIPARIDGASAQFLLLLGAESGAELRVNRIATDLLEGMGSAEHRCIFFSPPY